MACETFHPQDSIGNRIYPQDLLHVTLPQSSALFHVVKVESASAISGPDGKPLVMNGRITVVCQFDLPYSPGQPLGEVLVLKQPKDEKLPAMDNN